MATRRSTRNASKASAAALDTEAQPLGHELKDSEVQLGKRNGETKESLLRSKTAKQKPVDKASARKRKVVKVQEEAEDGFKVPDVPSTPQVKRQRKPAAQGHVTTPIAAPLLTPTPSTVNAIAHSSPTLPKRTPAKSRKAAPHATNAPLQTPQGSRIVRYTSDLSSTSASKLLPLHSQDASDRIPTTTDNLLEKACAHLISVDPKLKTVIDRHHCKLFSPEGLAEVVEPFQALSSGIIAQQVSGAAASSIKKKFISLFTIPSDETKIEPTLPEKPEKHFPTPTQVVDKDIATLRTAGLSQRKAEYIHGLAEKFVSGELSAQMLIEASDEEVLENLVAVRGLGRWSVEMFACFALKRMDIFSTGDLGVQRGMAAYKGRDVAKLKNKGGKWKYMSEADMLSNAEPFAPYRSLFMWYMWRIEDVNLDALS